MANAPINSTTPDLAIPLHWGAQAAPRRIAQGLVRTSPGQALLTPEQVSCVAIGMMDGAVAAGATTASAITRWMERQVRGEAAAAHVVVDDMPARPSPCGDEAPFRAPWEG